VSICPTTSAPVSGERRTRSAREPAAGAEAPLPPAAVTLPVDGIAYQELTRESERHGISPSELASFAILYYLADVDSGRIARRIAGVPRRETGLGDAR
jgi:hypothetical protein